jgi:hypothetical protein
MFIAHVVKTVKENWIKSAAATLTAIVALFTGLWTLDSHYAKAEDLNRVERRMDANQQVSAIELQIQLNKQWMRNLQNQLDDIDARTDAKVATPVDRTKRSRITRQLEDLKHDNDMLTQQKFELQRSK